MNTSASSTTQSLGGFDQIATGLRSAVDEFEKTATKENIGFMFALLRPVADVSQRAISGTVDYSRRHPVRVAVTLVALGLLAAKFIPASSKAREA